MRKALPTLLAVGAIAAAALTGCSSTNDRYVCRDQVTQQRVTDDRCNHHSGYGWWLLNRGSAYPAVGGKLSSSSGKASTPKTTPKPLPTTKGTAPKGKLNLGKSGSTGSKARSGSHSSSHFGGGHVSSHH
jgi:hypothetical protein